MDEMNGMNSMENSVENSAETAYEGVSPDLFEPPKNNKKKWLLAGGAAAGLIVVIAVIAVAGSFFFQNSQKKFVTALVKAMTSAPDENDDLFGFEQMAEAVKETPYHYGGSLVLEDSNITDVNAFSGLGFTAEVGVDYDTIRRGMAKFMVSYDDMDVAGLSYYLDPQGLKLSVPGLSDRLMTLDYQEGFEQRLYSSYMMESMGMDQYEMEEFAEMLIAVREMMEGTGSAKQSTSKEIAERFQSSVKLANRLEDEMEVERSDSKSFTLNGKETTCTGYTAVISHETLMAIFRDLKDFVAADEEAGQMVFEFLSQMDVLMDGDLISGGREDLEEDLDRLLDRLDGSFDEIRMKGYIDHSGNMASLTIETGFEADGDQVSFSEEILFKGGSYLAENMEVTVEVDDGYNDVECRVVREGGRENEVSDTSYKLSVQVDGEKLLTATFGSTFNRETKEASMDAMVRADSMYLSVDIKADGVFDQIDKGKGFHFDMDNLRLRAVGATMNFSGDVYCGPTDALETPEGEVFDLLTESESDWELLAMEIVDKLYELEDKLDIGW